MKFGYCISIAERCIISTVKFKDAWNVLYRYALYLIDYIPQSNGYRTMNHELFTNYMAGHPCNIIAYFIDKA
jgi:hypothetical protein